MEQILHTLHEFVWSPGMLAFFLLTGIYFTVQSKFYSILRIKQWFGQTLGSLFKNPQIRNTKETQTVSQFQSFCTALAATLGTGNITGVATAIMAGGPGSIFWMWISAVLGMMTNYAENYLGITYRYKDEKGQWVGGAMVYIEKGLGCKWLAVVFSFCCIGASFGMGNMVQGKTEKISYKQKKSRPCPKERWTVVCHTHVPLVSEELFEAVQKKMAKNRKT